MKFTSKSYSENIKKNTTQRIKNAYELNNHKEKMILQYLKAKIKKKLRKNEKYRNNLLKNNKKRG